MLHSSAEGTSCIHDWQTSVPVVRLLPAQIGAMYPLYSHSSLAGSTYSRASARSTASQGRAALQVARHKGGALVLCTPCQHIPPASCDSEVHAAHTIADSSLVSCSLWFDRSAAREWSWFVLPIKVSHPSHFRALAPFCSRQEYLCLILVRLVRRHLWRHELPHLQQVALCVLCRGAGILRLKNDCFIAGIFTGLLGCEALTLCPMTGSQVIK